MDRAPDDEDVSSERVAGDAGPTAREESSPEDSSRRSARLRQWERGQWELVVAIILSVATVLSAWSGYESTRWAAKANRANRSATMAMFHASVADANGQREQMTATSLFIEWVRARLDRDPERADFVHARFRPEFLPIFDKWMATGTGTASGLPDGSPFTMKGYTTPGFVQADKYFSESSDFQLRANTASRTSQTYVLIAVMYASVLFFGGIATKFADRRASRLLGGLAAVMLIGATVELATQPVLFLIH